MNGIVYLLHHETSNYVYVGKTSRGMLRPKEHGSPSYMKMHRNLPVIQWIEKLRNDGYEYKISILEEASSSEALNTAEKFHISRLESLGKKLLNRTCGANGTNGTPLKVATQKRLRALIAEIGEYKTAGLIGVGYSSIARAASGMGLRRGTAVAIEVRLDAIKSTAPPKPATTKMAKTKEKR